MSLRVLIACETSGIARRAFAARGGAIHPKAMPVILTEPDEWSTWLSAPWGEAQALQRPLPDGSLGVE
jgi:putative SOS response-associated peptidase YedK